jgi:phage-related protein
MLLKIKPKPRNLMESLDDFIRLNDLDLSEPCNPKFFKFISNSRAIVCTQFIRKSIDKNFNGYEMPRHWSKTVKEEFRLHGDLISKVWRLVNITFKINHVYQPVILYKMLVEGALICFNTLDENTENKLTATSIIQKQQAINRKLQKLENPFNKELQPITWGFVHVCSTISEASDTTRADYQTMIKARMSLIHLMQQNQARLPDRQLIIAEKRGRKKS